jgi:hypothetical protein
VVEHARHLSLFAKGTTLQYYRTLIEKKRAEDAGADAAFSAWWEAAHEDLRTWDLNAFFRLVAAWGADRRPLHDRAFLRNWIARCVKARSGDEALRDADASPHQAMRSFVSAEHAEAAGSLTLQSYSPERT